MSLGVKFGGRRYWIESCAFVLFFFRDFRNSAFRYFGISVFRHFGISAFQHFGISAFRDFGISVFRHFSIFGISTFRYFGISATAFRVTSTPVSRHKPPRFAPQAPPTISLFIMIIVK